MHFNTKYIFQGDPEAEIVSKVNYNFDQILSFAVGPNGHAGAKGADGYPGPSGKRGKIGPTGERGILWFRQSTQPSSLISKQWDLWIDESTGASDIKYLGPAGSWIYSGYSLFSSAYFSSYSGISGPAGATDKFVIAFNNNATLTENQTSLLISDKSMGTLDSNPNRSKFIISTLDQTTVPIMSFVKSGLAVQGVPSFYWRYSGNSAYLRFNSNSSLSLTSALYSKIDTSTAKILLSGNTMSISANNDVRFYGASSFYINSNTTVGNGSAFSVSSKNLVLTSAYSSFIDPIKVTSSVSGVFAFDSTKNITDPGSASFGVQIETSNVAINSFEFIDSNNAAVFSGKPNGDLGSGKFLQTVFGSTGGLTPGGTAGPYFYHVKKVNQVRKQNSGTNPDGTMTCVKYGTTAENQYLKPVLDLTDLTLWNSNCLSVTPYGTASNSIYGVYLRIPSPVNFPAEPLAYPGLANQFRVFLNNIDSSTTDYPNDPKILGLVWDYTPYTAGVAGTPIRYYMQFPYSKNIYNTFGLGCSYVDLFWSPATSSSNSNPKIFWKTCTGSSGFLNTTNRYGVGVVGPGSTTSTTPNPGSNTGGGGGSTTCFLAGTLITMSDGSKKAIENIKIGDSILSYDLQSESVIFDSVSEIFNTVNSNIVEISFGDGVISRNTWDHPYWVVGKGWASFNPDLTENKYNIKTSKLSEGDILLSESGEHLLVSYIAKLDMKEQQTYNFHAERSQNYFANGVLVHNKRGGFDGPIIIERIPDFI